MPIDDLQIFVVHSEQISSEGRNPVGEEENLDSHPFKSWVTNKWLNVIMELNGLLCVCDNDTYHIQQKKLLPTGERLSNLEYNTVELKRITILKDVRSHMMDWKYYNPDDRVPNVKTLRD